MSGKTMLAHAISEHLKKKYPEFKVNSITWAPPPVPLYRNMDPWLSYLASFTEEPSKWLLQQDNLVYIIDEAEQSFKDKAFWNSCLRTASRHDHGPYFVLLSSYGSASDAIIDPLSAPPKIGLQWDQRITFSRVQLGSAVASLCFDEEEFEFLCRRLCEHLGQGIIMSSDLKDYIFELTDGHPGLTDTLVRALLQSRVCHYGCICIFNSAFLANGSFLGTTRYH